MRREAETINLDRAYAESDRQRTISRRTLALLAAAGEAGPDDGWYVLTVAGGCEKAVDKVLEDVKVRRWLPLVRRLVLRRGGRGGSKRIAADMPVWPGYLFVRIADTAAAWAGLRTVEDVTGVLGLDGRPERVEDAIIMELRAFVADEAAVREAGERPVKAGSRVALEFGLFGTVEGVVRALTGRRARVDLRGAAGLGLVNVALDRLERLD